MDLRCPRHGTRACIVGILPIHGSKLVLHKIFKPKIVFTNSFVCRKGFTGNAVCTELIYTLGMWWIKSRVSHWCLTPPCSACQTPYKPPYFLPHTFQFTDGLTYTSIHSGRTWFAVARKHASARNSHRPARSELHKQFGDEQATNIEECLGGLYKLHYSW